MKQQNHPAKKPLEQRVIGTAEEILSKQSYVRPMDVLIAIGWLQQIHARDRQRGKIPFLEKVIQCNLTKLNRALECLHKWALKKGLKPSETIYMSHNTTSRKQLRFSKTEEPTVEQKYSTHYISSTLGEKKIQRLKEKWEQSPDLIVFYLINDSKCDECHKELFKGSLLFKNGNKAECVNCAKLESLVFLPSGNAKLTHRAKNYSNKSAIVVKFSRTRKRYDRQGIMIEKEALKKAQSEIESKI